MKGPILAIAGPTASGKSELGKLLAKKYSSVIISVDSRQVYKELDIGSGKDKSFHQEMIDIVNPEEKFSVAEFSKRALLIVNRIHKQNKMPILVGGTGYYLDAILYKRNFPKVRNIELTNKINKYTTEKLIDDLTKYDPASVARCGMNRRRLVRALEIVLTTNKPVPNLVNKCRFNHLLFILDPGKEKLDKLIEKRIKKRFQTGMIDEVKKLLKKVDPQWLINLGLEYKYITLFLQGKLSQQEMENQLLIAEIQYSNRQRTWFRRYKEAVWVDNYNKIVPIVNKFVLAYNKNI